MHVAFAIIEFVVLIAFLAFFFIFMPHLDYPKNNEIVHNTSIEFKFRNANVIFIDDNSDFSSPREIDLSQRNVSEVIFEPGTYYWKVAGMFETNIWKFTIPSEVGLELKNSTLKNTGNVKENVTKENIETGTVTGLSILDVQIEYPAEEENKTIYKGEQYGK